MGAHSRRRCGLTCAQVPSPSRGPSLLQSISAAKLSRTWTWLSDLEMVRWPVASQTMGAAIKMAAAATSARISRRPGFLAACGSTTNAIALPPAPMSGCPPGWPPTPALPRPNACDASAVRLARPCALRRERRAAERLLTMGPPHALWLRLLSLLQADRAAEG